MADEKKLPAVAVVQQPPPAEKSPEQKAAEAKGIEQTKPENPNAKVKRKPPWETVPGGRYVVDAEFDDSGTLKGGRVVNAHGKDPDARDNGPDPSTHPALLVGK